MEVEMKRITEEELHNLLLNTRADRHRRVSQVVEEVQRIMVQLTAQISLWDSRFHSISNAGIHSDNLKVSGEHTEYEFTGSLTELLWLQTDTELTFSPLLLHFICHCHHSGSSFFFCGCWRNQDQPDLLAHWMVLLRGQRSLHPCIQVLAPSQLLVTVPLHGLSGFRQKNSRHWRYYTPSGVQLLTPVMEPEKLHQWLEVEQFQKSASQWHESDVNIQGDIVPARVLSVFQGLLHRAIPSCNLSDRVSVIESIGTTTRVNVETSVHMVEVELVPMVEIPGCWPRKARWPRFFQRWPSKDRARCVKSFGFDLIAQKNYHWQLSFLRAERLLLEGIDEDGGCRMKCLRVIRQLKEDVWCPGTRPVITFQHLQMVLLWECERNPSIKSWLDFGTCFLRLVRRLLKCSRQRFLRHYFIKRANLLKYADATRLDMLAEKLRRFLQSPSLNISSYLESSSVC